MSQDTVKTESLEDLSDVKLTGDKIQLGFRPVNKSYTASSKSSLLSRCVSRPVSAVPRLVTSDESPQEDQTLSMLRRPHSAGCYPAATSTNKSINSSNGTSNDTLESICVDSLPSSCLLKRMLEESVTDWKGIETEEKIEMLDEKIDESVPTVLKKIAEETVTVNNELPENTNACLLTPGLASKPPLPRKPSFVSNNTDNVSGILGEYMLNDVPTKGVNIDLDAIHDYLTLKFEHLQAEQNGGNVLGEDGSPTEHTKTNEHENVKMDLSIPEEVLPERDNGSNKFLVDEQKYVKDEEKTGPAMKSNSLPNFDEKEVNEGSRDRRSSYFWLEENMQVIREKESETDSYLKEIKNHCKSESGKNGDGENRTEDDLPNVSDIDLDALFSDENNEELKLLPKESNEPILSPRSPALTEIVSIRKSEYHTNKTYDLRKQRIAEYSRTPKVSPRTVNEKTLKSNAVKGKFVAARLKSFDDNIVKEKMPDDVETWIETSKFERKGLKNQRHHNFSEIMDNLEDLESTSLTDIDLEDIPEKSDPPRINNDAEVYDDIETILEVLESQDKASHNKIKSIKKIVTSELSNSLLLNEHENNLVFKGRPKKSVADCEECPNKHINQKTNLKLKEESRSIVDEKQDVEGCTCDRKTNNKKYGKCEHQHKQIYVCCGPQHQYKGSDKSYKGLLSYLDEMDKNCTKSIEVAKERLQATTKLVESSLILETVPKLDDLLTHKNEELASYVIDLSLRLKDKTSCVSILQNELSSVREQLLNSTKQSEQTMKQKLKQQKDESDATTKRHQKFIDQLISEKKDLNKRCEELVNEMKLLEERYMSNMKAVEQRHQVELQKVKDMHAAGERLRRERWLDMKTQKIKEMTVKSIEPEIQNMEKRQQQELSDLRSLHKREIEELELKAARKLQEHCEILREQLIQDREKALTQEREIMRQRYEKMVESEERGYQEQRRKLLADHASRIVECEEREAAATVDKERVAKQAQAEYEERLQAINRRHNNEIKLIKESAVLEMENWKNTFKKQQSAQLIEKESVIRKQCRKERDKEIETVIERLESEANKVKLQSEQSTENRIKRLKEKYENEIRDLELLERDAQSKYSDARAKLYQLEEVIHTLRTTVKQLETQLVEVRLVNSKLEAEREEIKETTRKDFENYIDELEKEIERLKKDADKQIEQLYSRVRVSLSRKDEVLNELTIDHKALQEKCHYLENMMEQQRKEFVIH